MAILFTVLVFLRIFGKIESWWTVFGTMVLVALILGLIGTSFEMGVHSNNMVVHSI
jgi:hypothetical protein